MVLKFDPDKVRANVQKAVTEDLLDRATLYRQDMEPEALEIIEEELARRGVDREAIAAWEADKPAGLVVDAAGVARKCSFCQRPAVAQRWGWHKVFGLVPLFPRRYRYCERHL